MIGANLVRIPTHPCLSTYQWFPAAFTYFVAIRSPNLCNFFFFSFDMEINKFVRLKILFWSSLEKLFPKFPTNMSAFLKKYFFVHFRPFLKKMTNIVQNLTRWCAWDSNPGSQDSRYGRIHWASPLKAHHFYLLYCDAVFNVG